MQQHAGTKGAEVGLDEQRMRVGIRIADFLFHQCAREREKVGGSSHLARPPSFAADQDESPQRGSGRRIPPLVSEILAGTTNAGARAQSGLTPDFLTLSSTMISWSKCRPLKRSCAEVGSVIPGVTAVHRSFQVCTRTGFHLIGARASFRLNLNYFNHGVQKKSATSASSSELRGALSPRRAKSVPASFVASSSSRKPLYANIVLFHTQKQLLPNPMVIRLVSVSDQMPLHEFHDVFRTILGWNGDLGYIVRVHGQEI